MSKRIILPALLTIFLLTRLINLTLLPVFNDEAIYIDWGQKMLASGKLYFSLFDGKQPLLMWFFGLGANIFTDPLFGARLVSVFFGLLSLIAIYKISQKIFSPSIALFAAFLYLISPIFLFYDRQALMESAVSCLGLWSLYFLHQLLTQTRLRTTIFIGLLWGLGLSLKSSFAVYIFSSLLIMFYFGKNRLPELINWLCLIITMMLLVLSPLLLQPDFSKIIDLNSRFAFTLPEIFSLPLTTWFHNLLSIFSIIFWQNLGLLALLIPLSLIKGFNRHKILVIWYLSCLAAYLFTTKSASPRYLISFLPLGIIFAADLLVHLPKKLCLPILIISGLWLIFLDLQLIFNPLQYFQTLNRVTSFSQSNTYTGTFTSGYGVKPAIDYITQVISGSPAIVGTRLDAGNPEDSIFFYLSKFPSIKVVYLDSKIISLTPDQSSLTSPIPIYYITRNGQLAGLDNLLIKQAEFKKPDGVSSVVVYQVRTSSY